MRVFKRLCTETDGSHRKAHSVAGAASAPSSATGSARVLSANALMMSLNSVQDSRPSPSGSRSNMMLVITLAADCEFGGRTRCSDVFVSAFVFCVRVRAVRGVLCVVLGGARG